MEVRKEPKRGVGGPGQQDRAVDSVRTRRKQERGKAAMGGRWLTSQGTRGLREHISQARSRKFSCGDGPAGF